MEAVWREGVRECVVASRIGKRRVDRRALTELSAPALHLGHCHAMVGGGHTFATEKLVTCELANMFISAGVLPHETGTNALTPCHCRRSRLPPPFTAAANFLAEVARLGETAFAALPRCRAHCPRLMNVHAHQKRHYHGTLAAPLS